MRDPVKKIVKKETDRGGQQSGMGRGEGEEMEDEWGDMQFLIHCVTRNKYNYRPKFS